MKYIILPTDAAENLNRQEAKNRGCQGGGTEFWYAMTPNHDGTLTALYVPDGYKTDLEKFEALPEGFIETSN